MGSRTGSEQQGSKSVQAHGGVFVQTVWQRDSDPRLVNIGSMLSFKLSFIRLPCVRVKSVLTSFAPSDCLAQLPTFSFRVRTWRTTLPGHQNCEGFSPDVPLCSSHWEVGWGPVGRRLESSQSPKVGEERRVCSHMFSFMANTRKDKVNPTSSTGCKNDWSRVAKFTVN